MQADFYRLADFLDTQLQAGETSLAYLSAEESQFVRFNKSVVRQAGSVRQSGLTLSLIAGQRRADAHLTLSGAFDADRALVADAVTRLRTQLDVLADDPYLLYNTEPHSSEHVTPSALPEPAEVLDRVLAAGRGRDLVGLYAGGAIYKGFANSLGQRNWHRVDNFHLDWCLYHAADKAVKSNLAGTHWDAARLDDKMADALRQLDVLARPAKTLPPGAYRAYLAPSAMGEIAELLSWGAFGVRAQRTKQSPLLKLEEGAQSLHPAVSFNERSIDGVAPLFNADGFIKAPSVPLIAAGRWAGALASPRSAKEYDIATNGANGEESPESLEMAAGDLKADDVLPRLDTGLLIGNLHYLNYSDRINCRMTGMTRFATFWVENGEIVAPVNVMRFDDTVYRLLGSNLEALNDRSEWILDGGSYGERSTGSYRLPGALVRDFALTL